jgi:hypothetical protein
MQYSPHWPSHIVVDNLQKFYLLHNLLSKKTTSLNVVERIMGMKHQDVFNRAHPPQAMLNQ